MKKQNTNRILPIKSLLENLKHQTKKQYLQLDSKHPPSQHKNQPHIQAQNNVASRISSTNSVSMTHRPLFHNELSINQQPKQLQKGISLNKTSEKINSHTYARQLMHAVQFPHPSFYTPKKDKGGNGNPHFSIITQDTFKMEAQLEHHNSKNNKSEQYYYQTYKPVLKNPEHRAGEDFEKEALNLTEKFNSKFEEETRYVSKFEKIDSQPIFKDEITKTKTELYQKEAMLFQRTQELEEKEKIIASLQDKLRSISKNSDHNVKQKEKELKQTIQALHKRIEQLQEDIKAQRLAYSQLEQKFETQSIVIDQLRSELQETSEELCRYEQDNETNYALINLKLRQYEVQEKQRSHRITEIKEKQRRTFEHQERVIKNLNESLRVKEQVLLDMKSKLMAKQEMIKRQQQIIEEKRAFYMKELQNKEYIIRELLAEEGDLKNSLKNMEFRIREMIEEEEQLKKIIDQKKVENKKLIASLNTTKQESYLAKSQVACLEQQLASENDKKVQFQTEIQQLTFKLSQADQSKKSLEEFHQNTIKDMQLRLASTSEAFSQRQHAFSKRIKQLDDRVKHLSTANRANPSKTSTSKLIKDNERLSLIIKDIDGRLYQSLKLNQTLNQQITKRELMALNGKFFHLSNDLE